MKLLSFSYMTDEGRKYAIMLELGRRSDKICGLYSHLLDAADVDRLNRAAAILDDYPLEDRLRWVREHVAGFNTAYREITATKVEVEDSFELGKKHG